MSTSGYPEFIIPSNVGSSEQCHAVKAFVDQHMYQAKMDLPDGFQLEKTTHTRFVPLRLIDHIATAANIDTVVANDDYPTSAANNELLAKALLNRGRRFFVSCCYFEMGMKSAAYLLHGNYDENQPVQSLPSEIKDHPQATRFLAYQYRFVPPIWCIGETGRLCGDFASLPFTKIKFLEARPLENIYQVTIHPDHLDSAAGSITSPDLDYRMRQIHNGVNRGLDPHWKDMTFGFFYGTKYFLCYR